MDLSTGIANNILSQKSSFVSGGKNISEGVAKGIESGISNVKDATQLICSNTESSVKEYFGIQSPSTLMYSVGEYIVQGLINGMNSASSSLKDAFALVDSAIQYLEMLGDEGIDIKVRVTPVIDSTALNSQFSGLQSVAMGAGSSLIGDSTMRKLDGIASNFRQNGVGSIDKLTGSIDALNSKLDDIDPSTFEQHLISIILR